MREDLIVRPICRTISNTTLTNKTYIPELRLPVRSEINPISHVTDAEPSVPSIKSGVARRLAVGPKVFEKRDTFVGNIHDVPKPAIMAPKLN